MPPSAAQLQQENKRLKSRCETLETELTELQQRYQAISRSEARYRQVVKNSPISTVFVGSDGQLIEANTAFTEHFGFTIEDAQQAGFNIFTDPALEENGTRPYILRALVGETVIEPPTNFYNSSHLFGDDIAAKYLPGQGHYFPIWDENGEVQEIVEMSPSVTDLLEAQAEVQAERDRAAQERAQLLSTVAQVANLLLRSQDYTTVFPDVVRQLGEAVGSDRCAITQEMLDNAGDLHRVRLLNQWCREGIPSVLKGSPELGPGVELDSSLSFYQPLLKGEAVSFVVAEVEEPAWRDFFEAHHNVSMLIVPIMLSEDCWGHIGFDNCHDASLFEDAEIAILQVAAESIAAAIERQHQDKALRESEERYRALFELSGEGIYRFELDQPISLALSPQERLTLGYRVNRIAEVNQAFAEQYGFDTPGDLVGTKISAFYDREYLQTNDRSNLGLMRDLQVSKIETVETDRSGNRRWFLSSVVCDVHNDAIVGGWGVQTDITELKQAQQSLLETEQARAQELERYNAELRQALDNLAESEKRYRTLFELSGEGIYRVEFDQPIPLSLSIDEQVALQYQYFRAVEANNTYLEMYGLDNAESLGELRLNEIHIEGSEQNLAFMRALVENDWHIRGLESEEIDAQGNRHYFLNNIVPDIRDGYVYGNWGTQTDITKLRQALEQLQARDCVLQATSTAADALLTTGSLEEAVNTALQIIGESLDTDRIAVLENEPYETVSDLSQVKWELLYEWHSSHIFSQLQSPEHKKGTFAGIETWPQRLAQGESISYPLAALPEPFRSTMAEVGVQSIHEVPIFVEGNCWGALGIDDCRETKHRDPAELAVLKTAAACIGSAIERDRTQKAILQAEQERAQELEQFNTELQQTLEQVQARDRILEATAEATNALLSMENLDDAVNAALKIIGESLDTDRINIIEIEPFDADSNLSQVRWRVLNDWYSTYTASQRLHPIHNQGDHTGIEHWLALFSSGQSASFLLEDMPEPFRSSQAELGVKAYHAVPIFLEGRYWGNLGIDDCREAKHRAPAELSVLKTTAACIGSAIERDRTQQVLLAAEQNRVTELAKTNQALKNSLDRLAANPDLDAFLGYVLTEISQQFDGKTATLYHFDPSTQLLNLHQWVDQGVVHSQEDFHQLGPLTEPISAVDSTAWDFLLENKFPLVITRDNAQQYMFPGTQDWQLKWANRENLQAGINILLSSGKSPLGMLCVFSAKRSEFTSEELEIAQALSHQATLAIQLTRLATEAQQAAILGERNRLAREIHDTLAQAFGGVIMQLQAADYFLASRPDTAWNHVQMAQKLSQDGLDKARRSVWTLYLESTEYEDLVGAIHQFIAEKQKTTTTAIDLHIDGTPYSLRPELGLNLLRIAQEAIVNALRHAHARVIEVSLSYTHDCLKLTISDDGQGFSIEVPSHGFGLIGMQQRANKIAGQLQLISQLQQGTQITVTVGDPIAS